MTTGARAGARLPAHSAPSADSFPRLGPAAPRARASGDLTSPQSPAPATRRAALRWRRQLRWQRRRRRRRQWPPQPHTPPPNWKNDGSRTPGGERPTGAAGRVGRVPRLGGARGSGAGLAGQSWSGRARAGEAERSVAGRASPGLGVHRVCKLLPRKSTFFFFFFLFIVAFRGGVWVVLVLGLGTGRCCPKCGASVRGGLGSGAVTRVFL